MRERVSGGLVERAPVTDSDAAMLSEIVAVCGASTVALRDAIGLLREGVGVAAEAEI